MSDLKRKLYKAKSPLHGNGLFSRVAIAQGTELGVCKTRKTRTPGLYTLTLDEGETVDVTCKLKYINHGRPANVSYYDDFSVVALADIAPGEELLHDYGDEWD